MKGNLVRISEHLDFRSRWTLSAGSAKSAERYSSIFPSSSLALWGLRLSKRERTSLSIFALLFPLESPPSTSINFLLHIDKRSFSIRSNHFLQHFKDACCAHSAADTHGDDAELFVLSFEFIHQSKG